MLAAKASSQQDVAKVGHTRPQHPQEIHRANELISREAMWHPQSISEQAIGRNALSCAKRIRLQGLAPATELNLGVFIRFFETVSRNQLGKPKRFPGIQSVSKTLIRVFASGAANSATRFLRRGTCVSLTALWHPDSEFWICSCNSISVDSRAPDTGIQIGARQDQGFFPGRSAKAQHDLVLEPEQS